MLKTISEKSHNLIKVNRRYTLTDSQLENCFGRNIFSDEITDETSEYSRKSDEYEINAIPHCCGNCITKFHRSSWGTGNFPYTIADPAIKAKLVPSSMYPGAFSEG